MPPKRRPRGKRQTPTASGGLGEAVKATVIMSNDDQENMEIDNRRTVRSSRRRRKSPDEDSKPGNVGVANGKSYNRVPLDEGAKLRVGVPNGRSLKIEENVGMASGRSHKRKQESLGVTSGRGIGPLENTRGRTLRSSGGRMGRIPVTDGSKSCSTSPLEPSPSSEPSLSSKPFPSSEPSPSSGPSPSSDTPEFSPILQPSPTDPSPTEPSPSSEISLSSNPASELSPIFELSPSANHTSEPSPSSDPASELSPTSNFSQPPSSNPPSELSPISDLSPTSQPPSLSRTSESSISEPFPTVLESSKPFRHYGKVSGHSEAVESSVELSPISASPSQPEGSSWGATPNSASLQARRMLQAETSGKQAKPRRGKQNRKVAKVHDMLPKPVLGESTPNTKVGDIMEEVGSPMEMNQSGLLSPIAANPPSKRRRMDREESTSSSQLSPAVSRKAAILNAARQLEETYAFRRAKPARRPKKKSAQQYSAELKAFLDKMNAEFAEIEKVELDVVKVSPSEVDRDYFIQ